jgi:hypothetical protein
VSAMVTCPSICAPTISIPLDVTLEEALESVQIQTSQAASMTRFFSGFEVRSVLSPL